MIHMKAVELFQLANMGCLSFSSSHFSLSVVINVVPLMTLSVLRRCHCYCSVWFMKAVRPPVLTHGLWSQESQTHMSSWDLCRTQEKTVAVELKPATFPAKQTNKSMSN